MTDDFHARDHAYEQWFDRVDSALWVRHPLRTAWREGEPVDAPEVEWADETRLYELPDPHRDMLLTAIHTADGPEVQTVLVAHYDKLPTVPTPEAERDRVP